MAQAGYTPISLYYGVTGGVAPSASNLIPGEIAINIANTDMSMYFENASGTVKKFFNNPAALTYPTADGTNGQVITTDGAGNLSFTTPASGGVTVGQSIAFALIFGL